MKAKFLIVLAGGALLMTLSGCQKASLQDENAWIYDDSKPVPVLFNSASSIGVSTKAQKSGLLTGSVMSSLDVGIVSVAEKTADSTPVRWSSELAGSILIDNLGVTTSEGGDIVFSPKVYYPFGNKYAYSFYSYYPYRNSEGDTAEIVDSTYSITYSLGDTDILWASAQATDFDGIPGFSAPYCRSVKQAGVESQYFPKLQYEHLLTALCFRVVGKEADIENYDVKVTGMQITGTSSKATLCIADSRGVNSGVLTGNEDGGTIGFTDLSVAPTATEGDLCTILAMPGTNYNATITLSVDGANVSSVDLELGKTDGTTRYDAGYIYYFTITVNNPEEITIVETGLTEWKPGTNPVEGSEI